VRALVAAGVAGLVILLSGCGDQTGPREKAQDTLNDETPVWSCINNGGTPNSDGSSCK
jgi:hypothetical protein